VRDLGRRRRRAEEGLFLAEGVRVAEELLQAGLTVRFALVSSAIEDTPRGQAVATRLREGATVRRVSDGALGRLARTRTPQGVLVVADVPAVRLEGVEVGDEAGVLVLDGVQDPGNIGTLARAAAAFGFRMVACLPGTVDPWNPKSVRASAGALFRIQVVETGSTALWDWLGRQGFVVLGADAAGTPLDRPGRGRVALVVGNEGAGLSDEARARCHRLVAVPMAAGTESLNVALAAGILLYELTRGTG
jgi:RNA methyltransferase, TrmH family